MPTITDAEFGEITVRRSHLARQVSLKVAPNGQLRISLPTYAPLLAAKMLIKSSRPRIRKLLSEHQQGHYYTHDQSIGKSHHLIIETQPTLTEPIIKRSGTHILVKLPPSTDITTPAIQQRIREVVITALRKEAKSYLPRRLKFLAEEHDFSYQTVKLTHASSRWGSCSSRGTISLNIALMNLPFELLDYVLIHELAHTRQMNHSDAFWREVAAIDPAYKTHRAALKNHTPHV